MYRGECNLMKDIKDLIKDEEKLNSWLVEVRRDFHMYPELSTEEVRTKQKIIEYLKAMKIPYREFALNHGLEALIEGEAGGGTVALRADMDALPITDEKKAIYKSKCPGKMHACGHDAHLTILLGAAKVLKENCKLFKGTVKLIFQPAEETIGGAAPMIKEGVLSGPKVDMIFGLHVSPEIETGRIGVKYGQMNASSDSIKIKVFGNSCHGAYPHQGTDAIVIVGYIITALQTIISRNVDPREAAVISIGRIRGGDLSNIIAEEVELHGTVRSLNEKTRREVLERIYKILDNITEAMGGSFELQVEEGYPALINHERAVDIVKNNGINLLGREKVLEIEKASLGVEDFAYFLQNTTGAFFRLGSAKKEKKSNYPAHSNLFDIDEDCLMLGVKLQVMNVLEFLSKG